MPGGLIDGSRRMRWSAPTATAPDEVKQRVIDSLDRMGDHLKTTCEDARIAVGPVADVPKPIDGGEGTLRSADACRAHQYVARVQPLGFTALGPAADAVDEQRHTLVRAQVTTCHLICPRR